MYACVFVCVGGGVLRSFPVLVVVVAVFDAVPDVVVQNTKY